ARFLVPTDREVIAVAPDLFSVDSESLGCTITEIAPATADLRPRVRREWQVILDDELALVVERVAVGLHVDEQHTLGLAAFREDENACRHTGIGLEYAGRKRDDCFKLVLVDKLRAQLAVGRRRTEQHAVRNNHGATSAWFQHSQDERDEEKLCLLG